MTTCLLFNALQLPNDMYTADLLLLVSNFLASDDYVVHTYAAGMPRHCATLSCIAIISGAIDKLLSCRLPDGQVWTAPRRVSSL